MRLFKMPAWKVGQPTLRVLALLLVSVAMPYVIGACAKRPPPDVRQEALVLGLKCSNPKADPQKEGRLILLDGGDLDPEHLCLKPGASLAIENHDSKARTLCFSPQEHFSPKNPFKDGDPAIRVDAGNDGLRTIKDGRRGYGLVGSKYNITVTEDGCDRDEGHGLETGNGTLEVATGNPNEGPDGGQ